jgi:hypothetical protein
MNDVACKITICSRLVKFLGIALLGTAASVGCDVPPEGTEPTTAVEATSSAIIGRPRAAVQLSDGVDPAWGGAWGTSSGEWSQWVSDSNGFNPNGGRIRLELEPGTLVDQDIRICVEASENFGRSEIGVRNTCTDWASKGGGDTGFVGDGDNKNFDSVRVRLEFTEKPGLRIDAMRLGIRFMDAGPGRPNEFEWTPWNGGTSPYATDNNGHDPDMINLRLEAQVAFEPPPAEPAGS